MSATFLFAGTGLRKIYPFVNFAPGWLLAAAIAVFALAVAGHAWRKAKRIKDCERLDGAIIVRRNRQ